ncbi:MAG: endonuclease [Pseudomonadota bacterium]|jgi:endonuclease-3
MQATTIETLFSRFEALNPNPGTELIFKTPFELLIAVMLSAQATDSGVNRATAVLFAVANTPEALLSLGIEGLKPYIQRINLYPTKAKHIISTCAQLIADHQGQVPNNRSALESLPGVGPKTASVILNTLFDQATIAVDTHVFRVSNRMGLSNGKTPAMVEKQLHKVIPHRFKKNAHHWLVLHGRYVCRAKKPLCNSCHMADLCGYKDKTHI